MEYTRPMTLSLKLLSIAVVAAIVVTSLAAFLSGSRAAAASDGVTSARVRTAYVEDAEIGYEQKFRELAALHYRDPHGSMSFDAEWLGWGDGQTFYLAVSIPISVRRADAPLSDAEVSSIANRLSRGLSHLDVPHAIIRELEPIAIPAEECERGLRAYQDWMESKGWRVTYDREKRSMLKERIPDRANLLIGRSRNEIIADGERDGEAFAYFRGYRTRHVVLFASKGVPRE